MKILTRRNKNRRRDSGKRAANVTEFTGMFRMLSANEANRFIRYMIMGESIGEIAERENVSVQTVSGSIRRARRKLRIDLNDGAAQR